MMTDSELLKAYQDTGMEPEAAAELKKSVELERRVGSVAGKHLDSIIQASEKVIAHIEDREELQAYHALGPVEELSALVKARDDGRVLPKKSMWTMTLHGSKLALIVDVKAAQEAEAALNGGGGDG